MMSVMTTTTSQVLRLKHAFAFLRHLKVNGPDSFTGCWRALGCYPKSMSRLAWSCADAGLVAMHVNRYGLTVKGDELLELWERLVALDGEPVKLELEPRHKLPPDKELRARAMRAAMSAFEPTEDETLKPVATDAECNKTFTELDAAYQVAGRPAAPAAEALARARAGLERKPVRIVHRGVPEPTEPNIVSDDECLVCKWGER